MGQSALFKMIAKTKLEEIKLDEESIWNITAKNIDG